MQAGVAVGQLANKPRFQPGRPPMLSTSRLSLGENSQPM
jgi:hypothetical protein